MLSLKSPGDLKGRWVELKESWGGARVGDLASVAQNVDVSNIGCGVTRDLPQPKG